MHIKYACYSLYQRFMHILEDRHILKFMFQKK
jgi:hypothetical protein